MQLLLPRAPAKVRMPRAIEQAWGDGRLRVWRDGRLIGNRTRRSRFSCTSQLTPTDAAACSVEQRPGTVIGVRTPSCIRYDRDKGAVITVKKPRWEFDRAGVEALLAPSGNDRKRARRALLAAIVKVCPDYEDMGTGVVMKQVGDWLKSQGKPVPGRDTFDRAMGRRVKLHLRVLRSLRAQNA